MDSYSGKRNGYVQATDSGRLGCRLSRGSYDALDVIYEPLELIIVDVFPYEIRMSIKLNLVSKLHSGSFLNTAFVAVTLDTGCTLRPTPSLSVLTNLADARAMMAPLLFPAPVDSVGSICGQQDREQQATHCMSTSYTHANIFILHEVFMFCCKHFRGRARPIDQQVCMVPKILVDQGPPVKHLRTGAGWFPYKVTQPHGLRLQCILEDVSAWTHHSPDLEARSTGLRSTACCHTAARRCETIPK